MKILVIHNFFCEHAGAEKSMYQEAVLLREKGHQVYFFATDRKPYFEKDYKFARYFPTYIDYNSLSVQESFKYLLRPFYNHEAEYELKKYLRIIKPDIVHCHSIYYHLTPSVLNACYEKNIPVVMTLRDSRLVCPSGTLMFKGNSYCHEELCIGKNPLNCLLNSCKNKSFTASAIVTFEHLFNRFNKLYENINMFICPSQALLELTAKSGIPRSKLTLLNNFIDDRVFRDNIPDYSDLQYFLYAGRLAREKGVHYLLEAMSQLPDIRLRIAGNGPEEENLKELARELNLQNVEFVGYKKGRHLEKEYRNCIATILPCNWFENFPRNIIESFAHGKAVIGSNIGGIPEIIDDGLNGIIFEPGNVTQLVGAIKMLNSDRNLAIRMGRLGREKAESFYTSDIHYEQLIKIYQTVLDSVKCYKRSI